VGGVFLIFYKVIMKKRIEHERPREELVSYVAECIIYAALLDNPEKLPSVRDICKKAKISKHSWQGIKSEVEDLIADRYEGAELCVEQIGLKGEESRRLNIYKDGKTLFRYVEDAKEDTMDLRK
jgi:hypothetical protein